MPSLASKLASLAPAPLRDAASSAVTHATAAAVAATDSEWMPDAVLRAGIRALLKHRDGEVRFFECYFVRAFCLFQFLYPVDVRHHGRCA